MKRFFKIVLGVFLFVFLLLLLIPIFFKDKIRDKIVSEFDKNTEATLYFDIDKFGLSLITNFPDFTVSLGDFGVIGKGVFEGDTLANVKNLEAQINLREVLFGDAITIKGVNLDSPDITIIVLEDGTANYDIMKVVEGAEEINTTESEGSLSFGIKSFLVSNGDFIYFDQSSQVFTQLNGINIYGKGDFAEDIFDLVSEGKVDAATFAYNGTEYVTNKTLTMDLVMSMDLPNMKFTFKENEFLINEFPLAANGSFTMFDDSYGMDLSFSSPSSEFKKIFSLIPGAYTESFDDVKATGNVSFSGMVKGKYSDTEMPAFGLNLNIDDASVQYPGLPETIDNIQVALNVDNPDGVIENTVIDLKKMHIDFGKNPFDARLKVANLKDYPIDAYINGTLNLKDLNSMLPIEGLVLDGIMTLNAKANGKYDSLQSIIPTLDITMNLKDGKIQSTEFPIPLEKINVVAEVLNPTGKMKDTKINVSNMDFVMDGQPFQAKLMLQNPDNFEWDATAKGTIDLEKIFKIYPMEGVQASGIIMADLSSKGRMSDIENERYQNLDTKGVLKVTNLVYADEAMGKTFKISSANTSFDKSSINLNELNGSAGETNFSATGKIENYLGFALNDGNLKGNLNATADVLNVNEWMTESEEEVVDETGEPMQVVRIPENVEFNMNASVNKVIYNKLELKEVKSGLVVKDGKVALENANMKTLNGTVGLQGSYDSKPEKPLFAFGFKVKEISIPQSFQSIEMIQKLAPIAEKMQGLLSTDFAMAGALGADMMPDYSTLSGSGVLQLLQASLDQDSKIVTGLTSLTKLQKISTSTLDKVKMSAEIKDGRLFVKPFDVNLGDYKTTIAGSTGIDGSIDYTLGMDVQAGQIGAQLNSLVSQVTGSSAVSSSTVRLNIGMSGTYAKPEFGLRSVGSGDGTDVKSAVTASVKAKVEEKKEEVKQEVQVKVDQAKDSANIVLDAKKTELKSKADSLLKSQTDSAALKLAGKLGVKKDTTEQKLEEAKKKAESVLKGILKKKKGGGGN
ncbi:AsmA-like C-terminal region-containing protein [Roseivirga sp.]|uniref:AsmA-like C-terminal region-containing protein n=1 Tax=Roseivirga sp. TaxID=1964215 RepID=UPI002B26C257|nr:AsmA-like C-terminal region-containing protein [Roseivirga sp.]